ncbi:MAG: PocR ligand-binding domain-containing protein [Ignavibacteriae bacterium]|nr:PocR ligand-binding domain-containing protein [Ignavibacteriota bacterium]
MKEEFKSDSFQKLIQIFAREVLKDFQDHISHKFKLPSSLWIYDTNNGLNMLKPRSPFRYYPQFCEYLREIEGVSDKESHCTKYDITCMKGLIHHFNVNKSFDPFQLVNCHMNITRMVFPLSINDNVFGLLVLGKFRVDNDSSIQDIRQAINKVVSKEDYNLKKRLSHLINTLPIFNNDKINDYAIKTLELIPLLQSHYVHIQPYDPIFEGLIFIDNLDYGDSHAFLTYKAFWHNVTAFLNKIISQFNLASAIVYFSDTDNYAELHACAVAPQDHKFTKTLSLKSGQELHSLTISKKGVILPRKEEPLIWLNDFTDKIFGVKDCIVYAKYVFGGKTYVRKSRWRGGTRRRYIKKIWS